MIVLIVFLLVEGSLVLDIVCGGMWCRMFVVVLCGKLGVVLCIVLVYLLIVFCSEVM